jgi:hypothetical protein
LGTFVTTEDDGDVTFVTAATATIDIFKRKWNKKGVKPFTSKKIRTLRTMETLDGDDFTEMFTTKAQSFKTTTETKAVKGKSRFISARPKGKPFWAKSKPTIAPARGNNKIFKHARKKMDPQVI